MLASVLHQNLNDLVSAFRKGIRCATVKHKMIKFMFNHNDLL